MSEHTIEHEDAAVFVIGSSTLHGRGDTTGPGIVGRLRRRYTDYTEWAYKQASLPFCRNVDVFDHTKINWFLPDYIRFVPSYLAESAYQRRYYSPSISQPHVAVFSVGMLLEKQRRQHGNEHVLRAYGKSFDTLRGVCTERNITPIIFALPRIKPGATYGNGAPIDRAFQNELQERTRHQALTWPEAHYVSFEGAVLAGGKDPEHCIAPDGFHPNTLGHIEVARALGNVIDSVLKIDSSAISEESWAYGEAA